MKNRWMLATVVAASLSGLAMAARQPGADKSQPAGGFDKKQLAAMMEMKGKPGPEHKIIEPLVGSFDVEIHMSMMPGMPPIVAKSTSSAEWVLGGRFVHYQSKPAAGEELKMEAISYFGYDQRTKKYFWWGIDSTDTYSVFAEGDYDDASKILTLFGENLEPGMGKVKYKTVIKFLSPESHETSIIFQAPDAMRGMAPAGALDKDGWFTVVTMKSTRRK